MRKAERHAGGVTLSQPVLPSVRAPERYSRRCSPAQEGGRRLLAAPPPPLHVRGR